jgi:hypothetical protein
MSIHGPFDVCHAQMDDLFPDVKARYALSYDPAACGGPASFAPVVYRNWLGPRHTAIYVVKYSHSGDHN